MLSTLTSKLLIKVQVDSCIHIKVVFPVPPFTGPETMGAIGELMFAVLVHLFPSSALTSGASYLFKRRFQGN